MEIPSLPENELFRVESLKALNILDSLPEERFDRIARLAKKLFAVPIAVVSLVDTNRQWFKSCVGLDAKETPRDISFCGHAILGDDILMIQDAALDARFSDNPLVTGFPHIRFYAGCPLKSSNGAKLGTLCLIDLEPRFLINEDKQLLRDLSKMAEDELNALEFSTTDELTRLSNRRGFHMLAHHVFHQSKNLDTPCLLLLFNIEEAKQLNGPHNSLITDNLTKDFVALLLATFRDSDVIARIDEHEFVVLLTSATQAKNAVVRFDQALSAYNKEKAENASLISQTPLIPLSFKSCSAEFDTKHSIDLDKLLCEKSAELRKQIS